MVGLNYYDFTTKEEDILNKFSDINNSIGDFIINGREDDIGSFMKGIKSNKYSDKDISSLEELFKKVYISKNNFKKTNEANLTSVEELINASEVVTANITTIENKNTTVFILSMIGPDKKDKSKLVYTAIGLNSKFDFTDIVDIDNGNEVEEFLNDIRENGFYSLLDIINCKYPYTLFVIPKNPMGNQIEKELKDISKIYVNVNSSSPIDISNIDGKDKDNLFKNVKEIEFKKKSNIDDKELYKKFPNLKKVIVD